MASLKPSQKDYWLQRSTLPKKQDQGQTESGPKPSQKEYWLQKSTMPQSPINRAKTQNTSDYSAVLSALNDRIASWSDSYNQYLTENNARYANRTGQEWVGDSAAWVVNNKKRIEDLRRGLNDISLDANSAWRQGMIDSTSLDSIKKLMSDFETSANEMTRAAQKDADYFSQWKDENEFKLAQDWAAAADDPTDFDILEYQQAADEAYKHYMDLPKTKADAAYAAGDDTKGDAYAAQLLFPASWRDSLFSGDEESSSAYDEYVQAQSRVNYLKQVQQQKRIDSMDLDKTRSRLDEIALEIGRLDDLAMSANADPDVNRRNQQMAILQERRTALEEEQKRLQEDYNLANRQTYDAEAKEFVASLPEGVFEEFAKRYALGRLGGNLTAKETASQYLMKTLGLSREEVQSAYDYLSWVMNARATEAVSGFVEDVASSGVWGAIGATAASVPLHLVQGVERVSQIGQTIGNAWNNSNRPIDTRTPTSQFRNISDTARQTVSGKILEQGTTKDENGAEKVSAAAKLGNFAYNTGMSTIDSAVMMAASTALATAIGGPVGLGAAAMKHLTAGITSLIMGSQVASDYTAKALESGDSPGDALFMGSVTGAIEGISEAVSVEAIIGHISEGNTNMVVRLLKSALSEGGEELEANYMNRIADVIRYGVTGREGEFVSKFHENQRRAGNDALAFAMTCRDFLPEDAESFVAGALSGGAMGLVGTAFQHKAIADIKKMESFKQMSADLREKGSSPQLDLLLSIAERVGGESAESAQWVRDRIESGNPPSDTELATFVKETNIGAAVLSIDEAGRKFQQQQQEIAEVEKKTPEAITADAIKRFGQAGNLYAEGIQQGQDVEGYTADWETAYTLGKQGVDLATFEKGISEGDYTTATPEQLHTAYEAGIAMAPVDAANRQSAVAKTVGTTSGNLSFDGGTLSNGEVLAPVSAAFLNNMSDDQKNDVAMIKAVAQALPGVNFAMFESARTTRKDGIQTYTGTNGAWDANTNTIYIAVNGKSKIIGSKKSFMAFVLSHELTHMMESGNPDGYKRLVQLAAEKLTAAGTNFNVRVQEEIDRSKRARAVFITEKVSGGMSAAEAAKIAPAVISYDGAVHEIVARTYEEAFINVEKARVASAELKKADRSLWEKIRDKVREFINKVLGHYAADDARKAVSREAQEVREWADELAKAWEIELARAGSFAAEIDAADTLDEIQSVTENSPTNDEGAEAEMSTLLDEKLMDIAISENTRKDIDLAMAKAARKKVKSVMLELADKLNLPSEDNLGKTITPNKSYGWSIENMTVCIRTLMTDYYKQYVEKVLGRTLTIDESLYVAQRIGEITGKPECYYCYVAADRDAYQEALGRFVRNEINRIQEWYKDGKTEEEAIKLLSSKFEGGKRAETPAIRARVHNWYQQMAAGKTEWLTEKDVAGILYSDESIAERRAKLSEGKRADFDLATAYAHQASHAKKRVYFSAYAGEILNRMKETDVELLNQEYGLRMYSYSDFSPVFILENMQMITDAAVKGLKVLAYTKEIDFAKIFASTGANIEISVFGYDQNGVVAEDAMMGAPWREAQELRKQYPNVGITFVALNDTVREWAEKQDWVDVVLPYHSVFSGGSEVARVIGARDWKHVQEDQKIKKLWDKSRDASSILPPVHQNDLIKYADALIKNHLEPRFAEYLKGFAAYRDKQITAEQFREMNPYYMKYVNETRRSAADTPPVSPYWSQEALDAAETSLRQLAREGGFNTSPFYDTEEAEDFGNEIAEGIRRGEKFKRTGDSVERSTLSDRDIAQMSDEEIERQAEKNYTNLVEALKREGFYQEGQPSGGLASPEELKEIYMAPILSHAAGRAALSTALTNAGYVSETTLDLGWEDGHLAEIKDRSVFTKEMLSVLRSGERVGQRIHFYSGELTDRRGNVIGVAGLQSNESPDCYVRIDETPGRKGYGVDRITKGGWSSGTPIAISPRQEADYSVTPVADHERLHYLAHQTGNNAVKRFKAFVSSDNTKWSRIFDDINFWYQRNHPQDGYDFWDYAEEVCADLYAGLLTVTDPALQSEVDQYIRQIDGSIGVTPRDMSGVEYSSLSDDELYDAYDDALKRNDKAAMAQMVAEAASRHGYKRAVAHGTVFDFDEFLLGEEGIHLGTVEVAKDVANKRLNKLRDAFWKDIRGAVSDMTPQGRRMLVEQAYDFAKALQDAGFEITPERYTGDSDDAVSVRRYVDNIISVWGKNNVRFALTNAELGRKDRVINLFAKINNPMRINGDINEWTPQKIAKVIKLRSLGGSTFRLLGKHTVDISGSDIKLSDTDQTRIELVERGVIIGDKAWSVLSGILERNDYDGIEYLNGYEGNTPSYSYIALRKNDVKSADPVTYDRNGKVIPLRERFNEATNLISHSTLEDNESLTDEEILLDPFADLVSDDPGLQGAVERWREKVQKLTTIYDDLNAQQEIVDSDSATTEQKTRATNRINALQRQIVNQRESVGQTERNAKLRRLIDDEHRRGLSRMDQGQRRQFNENFNRLRGELNTLESAAHRDEVRINELQRKLASMVHQRDIQAERVLNAKQRHREYVRRQIGRHAQEVIRNRVEALETLLNENSDKRHVPEALKAPLKQFLATFSTLTEPRRGRSDTAAGQAAADARYEARLADYRQALEDLSNALSENSMPNEGQIDVGNLTVDISAHIEAVTEITRERLEEAIAAGAENAFISAMSNEDLDRLNKMLASIQRAVTTANQLFYSAQFQTPQETAKSTMEEANGRSVRTDRFLSTLRNLLNWDMTTPPNAFGRMGAGGQQIFAGLQNGSDKLTANVREILDKANELFNGKTVKAYERRVLDVEVKDIVSDESYTLHISVAEAMSLYLLYQREQGRQHLMNGGFDISMARRRGVTSEDVERDHQIGSTGVEAVIDALREAAPEAIQLADQMQQFMASVGADWINEISMARFGYKFIEDGEQHYFPVQVKGTTISPADSDLTKQEGRKSLYRIINMSFTKPLSEKADQPIIINSVFDVFTSHMVDVAKYNALSLPLLDALRWFNFKTKDQQTAQYSGVKNSIRSGYGDAAVSYIERFLSDLNGVLDNADTFWDKASKRMTGVFKGAQVAANLRVALLQPVSYFRAAYVLKPKYLALGAAKGITQLRQAANECVEENGIAAWKDLGFYNLNITQPITQMIRHDASPLDTIREKSMALAGLGDKLTWGVLWTAVKAEVRADGTFETDEDYMAACREKFREVIYKTQVVDSVFTRSQVMRGQTAFIKMATAFMAEPTVSYNLVMDNVARMISDRRKYGGAEAWRRNKRNFLVGVGTYALSAVTAAAVEAAFDYYRDDDDDEEKSYLKYFKENFLLNLSPLNKIPILRDIESYLSGYDNERYDLAGVSSLIDAVKLMIEWYRVAGHKTDSEGKPYEWTKISYYGNMTDYGRVYKLVKAISLLSGLPFSNAMREVVSAWNLASKISGGEIQPIKTYEQGYGKKSKYDYQAWEAYKAGDQGAFNLLFAQLVDEYKANGKNAEDAEDLALSAINKLISSDYVSGGISSGAAMDAFAIIGGKEPDDAYWRVKELDVTGGKSDVDFSRYDRILAAITAKDEKEVQAATKELVTHGTKEDSISSAITRYLSQQYLDGELTEDELTDLYLFAGRDEDEAYWKARQLDATGGDSDIEWSKYDRLTTALTDRNRSAYRSAFDELTSHGVSESSVKSAVSRYVSQRYLDKEITSTEARSLLSFSGMDDNDIYWKIKQLDSTGGNPDIEWTKYDQIRDALVKKNGSGFRAAFAELTSHGVDESTVKNNVNGYISDMYLDHSVSASEAKALYQFAGMSEDDAYWRIRELDVTHGSSKVKFSRYDDMRAALASDTPSAYAKAVNELVSHGTKQDSVDTQTSTYIGELYKGGKISREQAIHLLQTYLGRNDKSAEATVKRWDTASTED